MKINLLLPAGLVAITLGLAAGCASTPEEPSAPAAPAVTEAQAKQAIADAKAANAEAAKLNAEWRDTGALIKQAEEAMAAGDYAKAVELANEAKRQAQNAIAQAKSEASRLGGATASEDSAASRASAGGDSYSVARGDSLWTISGKSEIYGNAYQWPLIYKANRDKIKDADLIYPNQVLAIDRNASSADVAAAVEHAKTRGAWSLGEVEASDTAYLSR